MKHAHIITDKGTLAGGSGQLWFEPDQLLKPPPQTLDLLSRLRGWFQRGVGKRRLLLVFRQLALLLETGIDIAEAIELVAAGTTHSRLKSALFGVLEGIRRGQSLSLSVSDYEAVFGAHIVACICAGEVSGRLAEVLRQIASQLEEELHVRSVIASSLAYPTILSAAAMVVGGILVWFVLPQFEESFASMAVTPPAFTRVLFLWAGLIRNHLGWWLAGGSLLVIVGFYAAAQPEVKRLIYKLGFCSPVLGPALRFLAIGQLFVGLGHLLANGISLLEALQLIQKSSHQGVLGPLVEAWEQDVLEGRGLTHSLAEFRFLPEGSQAMLAMAERTGKLEVVLTTAGTYYRQQGSDQLRQVLKLTEPLIIVLLGAFVGVVVASVLLPILDVQAGAAG